MSQSPTLKSRIAILGAGEVGSTIAYSLILSPVASEILLVDPKEDVRDAQVQDLSDASHQDGASTTRVRAGTHKEAGQCDVVVVTAGAKQKKGEEARQHRPEQAPGDVGPAGRVVAVQRIAPRPPDGGKLTERAQASPEPISSAATAPSSSPPSRP